MSHPIIELAELTKRYQSFTAVNNLNLTVNKGEIFGLLGPNGAGKSTTILMMLGLTEPTTGNVKVCGYSSSTHPIKVKQKVGYLPEDVGFYDDMTGLENILYTARLNCLPQKEVKKKAEQLLKRVGLSEAIHKKTGKYSRGMRQRLGLADVLVKDPEIIILDEPTSGIDPKGVHEFLDLIVKLRDEQELTVLFSSHNLHQVQQVCDRVGIFVEGKLLAEGNVSSLSEKLFANSLYLIEAGIRIPNNKHGAEIEWLSQTLSDIPDISSIKLKDDIFQIECQHEYSAKIAKLVIEAGASLTYLNKKEYGLDDIYNRYFEGGGKDE